MKVCFYVCRRHQDVQRRSSDGDGADSHGWDILHLPCWLPESMGRGGGPGQAQPEQIWGVWLFLLCLTVLVFPPGGGYSGSAAMCPGSGGPEEHGHPGQPPARPGGSRRDGHRHLDGLQQRLRPQPGQGLWTSAVHLHRRLGRPSFHVSWNLYIYYAKLTF